MQGRISHFLFFFLVIAHVKIAIAALPVEVNGQPLPSLADMLDTATPAVVNIATVGQVQVRQNPFFNDPFFRHFFDTPHSPRTRKTQSLGSGVIVDARQGYIITNHHVIKNANIIRVMLHDGRQFEAKLIGQDPESDVAVIQIPAENLTALPMADSDLVRVGDFVVAIGNPFGLGQTVTSGIVSALSRSGLGIEGYEDFIQTDASINPGNSGGALVDLNGHLVGINTAIIAPGGGNVGIGFAIPINMAHKLMQQLVMHGEMRRGQLGISVQDLTPELAEAFGLSSHRGTAIVAIAKQSPAAQAGLKVGDIIIRINDKPVRNAATVRNAVGLLAIGETLAITITRDGKERTVKAIIEAPVLDDVEGSTLHPKLAGARLSSIREGMPEFGRSEGVIIQKLQAGSPAARTGLQPGDIITSANKQSVSDVAGLKQALSADQNSLLLNIQRGDSALFLLIR